MNIQFTQQVSKSPGLDEVIARGTAKLERLLVMFRPGLVQLHGRLSHHKARQGTLCSLNLHLPTGQLAAEASAPTAQAAVRTATQELVEQIKKHKQRLRDLGPRVRAGAAAPVPPAPEDGRRSETVNVAEFLATNLPSLQQFVNRHLERQVALGQVAPGQLEAREVLDEMVAMALSDEVHPPDSVLHGATQRERWFYVLAVLAMRRLVAQLRDGSDPESEVSLDRALDASDLHQLEHRDGLDRYDDLRVNDVMADEQAATPEQEVYSTEVMRGLESALQRVPAALREDMVLFAMDGFSVAELAMVSQRSCEEVHAGLTAASRALAAAPELPAELRGRLVQRTEHRLNGAA